MLALRKIVKRFEFKPKDARGPLLAVMRITLPLLLAMSHQLIGDDSAEAGQVITEATDILSFGRMISRIPVEAVATHVLWRAPVKLRYFVERKF